MHHCHGRHHHHDPALVHCITKIFAKESLFPTDPITLEAMALFSNEGSKSVKLLYGKVRKNNCHFCVDMHCLVNWLGWLREETCFELPRDHLFWKKEKNLLSKGRHIWKDDEFDVFFPFDCMRRAMRLQQSLQCQSLKRGPFQSRRFDRTCFVFARGLFWRRKGTWLFFVFLSILTIFIHFWPLFCLSRM